MMEGWKITEIASGPRMSKQYPSDGLGQILQFAQVESRGMKALFRQEASPPTIPVTSSRRNLHSFSTCFQIYYEYSFL